MKFLVLDDDEERHTKFESLLGGPKNSVTHVYNLRNFIAEITVNVFDVIFLDHDLYDFKDLPDGSHVEFTGYDAAKALSLLPIANRPRQVFVHSWNPDGARRMMDCLKDNNFNVTRWVFDPKANVRF